jgi:hypothetical protein
VGEAQREDSRLNQDGDDRMRPAIKERRPREWFDPGGGETDPDNVRQKCSREQRWHGRPARARADSEADRKVRCEHQCVLPRCRSVRMAHGSAMNRNCKTASRRLIPPPATVPRLDATLNSVARTKT